jgi:hypothetical protein
LLEIAEHHAVHTLEGAPEAAQRIALYPRVALDRLCHGRVRELEQRRLAAADEERAFATDLPGRARGTVDPSLWLGDLRRELAQRNLEVLGLYRANPFIGG